MTLSKGIDQVSDQRIAAKALERNK